MSMNDRVSLTADHAFLRAVDATRGLLQQLVRIGEAIGRRRHLAVLAGHDDRLLADIGLTRSDVSDAASEPIWRDPTAFLARRVGAARSRCGELVKAWRSVGTSDRALAELDDSQLPNLSALGRQRRTEARKRMRACAPEPRE